MEHIIHRSTPREFSIDIKGKHYFGCDYIFSNIYGASVFSDEEPVDLCDIVHEEELKANPENGDYSPKTLEEFMASENVLYDLLSMPDCRKEIDYTTQGSVISDGRGGVFIRYSGDFSPICMHLSLDGTLTLNGQEDDFSELVFEKDKRNYVSLPETLFGDEPSSVNENQSPILLCLHAQSIESNITEDGGYLKVSYSIEVNGITAEVTDFTLTATPSQPYISEDIQEKWISKEYSPQ